MNKNDVLKFDILLRFKVKLNRGYIDAQPRGRAYASCIASTYAWYGVLSNHNRRKTQLALQSHTSLSATGIARLVPIPSIQIPTHSPCLANTTSTVVNAAQQLPARTTQAICEQTQRGAFSKSSSSLDLPAVSDIPTTKILQLSIHTLNRLCRQHKHNCFLTLQ